MTGRLVLVATPIGNLGDLSPRAVETLSSADVVACEDTRRTGRLLKGAGVSASLMAVHEHNEAAAAAQIVERVAAGQTVALVTDAGMPGISDPGERVVAAVVAAGHRVEAVPGPVAAIAALVVSGLPAERFVFEGFVPRKGAERTVRLAEIAAERRTTVLYEAPHRLARTLADLVAAAGGERQVVLARELTKLHEETWRGTLADAVAHVEAVAPRGEYVIVLAGRADVAATDEDVRAAVAAELAAGVAPSAAAATVAARLGVPRRAVYDVAVSLRERS